MRVTFYGVRGSCPCAGEAYLRYGGHTACLTVDVGDEAPIVIDLGTGLRPLGHDLDEHAGRGGPPPTTALLSHLHWDHIIGLPFFSPLLREDGRIKVLGPPQESASLHEVIDHVVKPPFFPVRVQELHGHVAFDEIADDDTAVGSAKVKARLVPHFGATLGFRIESAGASVAFIGDHQEPEDGRAVPPGVLELCDGADLVVHDAQYTDTEYRTKSTWGHSTVAYAVHVAAEAGARTLALFHHDPAHTDTDIDHILDAARDLPEAGRLERVVAAAEGMVLDVGSH